MDFKDFCFVITLCLSHYVLVHNINIINNGAMLLEERLNELEKVQIKQTETIDGFEDQLDDLADQFNGEIKKLNEQYCWDTT